MTNVIDLCVNGIFISLRDAESRGAVIITIRNPATQSQTSFVSHVHDLASPLMGLTLQIGGPEGHFIASREGDSIRLSFGFAVEEMKSCSVPVGEYREAITHFGVAAGA